MKIENQPRLKNSKLNLILTSNIYIHVGIQTFIYLFFNIFFVNFLSKYVWCQQDPSS